VIFFVFVIGPSSMDEDESHFWVACLITFVAGMAAAMLAAERAKPDQ
jgi:hypothetical protein